MKRYLLLTFLSLAILAAGCTREDMSDAGPGLPGSGGTYPLENDEFVKPGVLQIKLTPEAEARFSPVATRGGISTGVPSVDALVSQLGVYEIRRTFHHGGKHEEQMRKAGLHLWYNIYFDAGSEAGTMTRAFTDFSTSGDIEKVEPVLRIKRIEGDVVPVTEAELTAITRSAIPTLGATNDPLLHHQWHYHNEGTLHKSIAGADINLYEAWKLETGKPQVIVAVIDGGIDPTHPDLAPNLWVNEAELNGVEGEDDDDNGYIDDIHGFNFVTGKGLITAHAHGTHVGGTVAAVNNNGIGVAGVAGGNGSPDSGVRLMSLQIFYNDLEESEDKVVEEEERGNAFIYAAHNGAVIAQNSWEYGWTGSEGELVETDKVAIDYFIDHAGLDKDGNQTGPMRGGIVIFATGNSNRNARVLPSSYPRVFSVSGFAPDYTKAVYSNYGPWVHVSAPGGDGEYADGTMIFSTYPMGLYGFMSGTSMACPHVSGIAALVVSKYGVNSDGTIKPNFTNQQLWDRLYAGTNRTIRWFNPEQHPMGVGYINAHKALADYGEVAPDRVCDLAVEWTFEKAIATWRVTADSDAPGYITDHYKVVVSEEYLYGLDFSQLPATLNPVTVATAGKAVGEVISHEITGLEIGKTYYVSVAGFDADGNISPSTTVHGSPIENRGPVAVDAPQSVSLRKTEVKKYDIRVYDPEGYAWTHAFTPGSTGATATRTGDVISLVFDANTLSPGSYSAVLTLEDAQGEKTVVTIPYSVIYYAPFLVKEFEDILFQGPGHQQVFNLEDHFYDQDGDPITYSAESSATGVATAVITNGSTLTVASTGLGTATIKIVAKDIDTQTETSFLVTSRDASQTVDLYPVPVKKDGILNIRMGEDVNGRVDITIYSTSGARVFSDQVQLAGGAAAAVNIASLSTGNYRVVVKYKSLEITRNITKL